MKLEAVKTFRYARKDQQAGDEFEASERDAALFQKLKWAVPAASQKKTVDLPESVMSRAAKPEIELAEMVEGPQTVKNVRKGEIKVEVEDEDEAPLPKTGHYETRVMRAEDGRTGKAKSAPSSRRGRPPKAKT